jgi:hypothetical protein
VTYPAGATVPLYCDIVNARVEPLPPGVPVGVKLRVVVTQLALTVLWQTPTGEIGRVDVPMSEDDTRRATYVGGLVGPYMVSSGGGCSSCGSAALNRFVPFPNTDYVMRLPEGQVYGVPPARWERA